MVTIGGLEARPVGCNLGHPPPYTHLWDKDGFGYYRCSQCGLAWVSPQLTDEAVTHIYAQSFHSKQQAHQRPASFTAYRPLLRRLAPYRRTNRLLDVGCFTGNFLLAAQEAGWQVEGTEISLQAVEHARRSWGLTVHHGDLTTLDLPLAAYDVITLLDVIEHVSDPLSTLRVISELLRPGGLLYMETPHLNSLPRYVLGQQWSVFFPWHRTYFSAGSMRLALQMAGLRLRRISAVGVMPLSRHNPWRAYRSADSPGRTAQALAQTRFIARHKDALRPFWLAFKRSTELPFALLSRLGVHLGAKLTVLAERP